MNTRTSTRKIFVLGIIGMFVLLSQLVLPVPVGAAGSGNIPDPPPEAIKPDLSNVSFSSDIKANVGSWPATINLSVTVTQDTVNYSYDKMDQFTPVGGDQSVGNGWLFVYQNGWKATTVNQFRPNHGNDNKSISDILCGGIAGSQVFGGSFAAVQGQQYGFMVSGQARAGASPASPADEQRSNVVMATWNSTQSYIDCSSGSTSGTTGGTGSIPDSNTNQGGLTGNASVPPGDGSGVKAMDGTSAAIAFDPSQKTWFVAGGNQGTITGQLFDEDNKPTGSSISIGSGDTPEAAFNPDSNEFLVVWNNNNVVTGRLIKDDGTTDGASFRIGSGTDVKFFPNTQLQYDANNKKFVVVWTDGDKVKLNTVSGHSAGSVAAAGPFMSGALAGPTVAVDTKDNQYCVSSLDNNNSVITPFDPASGKAGSTATVGSALENLGIVYDLASGKYLVSWVDDGYNAQAYSLSQCAAPDKKAQQITLASDVQSGILTYSENGQVIGLLAQGNSSPIVNTISAFDGDGNSIGDGQQKLFGGGSISNDPQGLAVDTATNRFGAVSIQDATLVQFAGNVGGGSSINAETTITPEANSTVPSNGLPTDIAQLIEMIFAWSLDFIGLVIFVRFFWAGVKWFTSAGNTGKIGEAKSIMINTAIGALLLFSSYIILYTINPDLVKNTFNVPGLPAVGTSQSANSSSGTSCYSPLPKSKYAAKLQAYENTVLAKNPSLGQKSAGDSSALKEFIDEIIQQGAGMQILRPLVCNSSNVIPNSVLIGTTNDDMGEVCRVVSGTNGTISQLKTADCEFQSSWTNASP